MNWFIKCFKQYADFKGRARRKEYWMFFLISTLGFIAISIVEITLGMKEENGLGTLVILYALVIFIPQLSVQVRRLHDVGKSGWWLLIGIIPGLGMLVILWFSLTDSDLGENQYGPKPKEENQNSPSASPPQLEEPAPPSTFGQRHPILVGILNVLRLLKVLFR